MPCSAIGSLATAAHTTWALLESQLTSFHRLVQNMKTSLGWNYVAKLLGYSGGEADDQEQLHSRVDHACLALCPSDAVLVVLSLCGEDDDEDNLNFKLNMMADSTDEQSMSAEETVRQREWGSSDSEPSASHRAADVQLAVWGLARPHCV